MYSMILYEVHKQARLKTLHEKLIRNAIMKSVISSESTDFNFTNKRPNVQHLMIQQDAPAIKSYQTKKKNNRPLRLSTLLDLWVYKKKQWTENYMSPPDQPTPKCEEFCRTTDLVPLTNEWQKKKKKVIFLEGREPIYQERPKTNNQINVWNSFETWQTKTHSWNNLENAKANW